MSEGGGAADEVTGMVQWPEITSPEVGPAAAAAVPPVHVVLTAWAAVAPGGLVGLPCPAGGVGMSGGGGGGAPWPPPPRHAKQPAAVAAAAAPPRRFLLREFAGVGTGLSGTRLGNGSAVAAGFRRFFSSGGGGGGGGAATYPPSLPLSPVRRQAAIEECILATLRTVPDPLLSTWAAQRRPAHAASSKDDGGTSLGALGMLRSVEVRRIAGADGGGGGGGGGRPTSAAASGDSYRCAISLALPTGAYYPRRALIRRCTDAVAAAVAPYSQEVRVVATDVSFRLAAPAYRAAAGVATSSSSSSPSGAASTAGAHAHAHAHAPSAASPSRSSSAPLPSPSSLAGGRAGGRGGGAGAGGGGGRGGGGGGGGGAAPPAALAQVGAIVAVSSCKGGVGKSTVAVNLGAALAAMGGRVGLLDLDVYGPSFPTLLWAAAQAQEEAEAAKGGAAKGGAAEGGAAAEGNAEGGGSTEWQRAFDEAAAKATEATEATTAEAAEAAGGSGGSGGSGSSRESAASVGAEEMWRPMVKRSRTHDGLVLPVPIGPRLSALSFGWVNPSAGVKGAGGAEAAAVRGPVASRVATQLLLGTDWGPLDYLVLDMPPGTGDVGITVGQLCHLRGALVVTTPSALSHVDVLKGIALFETLKVPTLAAVENMARLPLPGGGELHPFGPPGRHLASLQAALPDARAQDLQLSLPVSEALRIASEAGTPLLLQQRPWHEEDDANDEEEDGEGAGASAAGPAAAAEEAGEETSAVEAFIDLAKTVVRRCAEEAFAEATARAHAPPPTVQWDPKRQGIVVRFSVAQGRLAQNAEEAFAEVLLPPEALRYADPSNGSFSNGSLSNGSPDSPPPPLASALASASASVPLYPVAIAPRGRYAVKISWSDGHEHPFFALDAVVAVAMRHL